MLKPGDFVKLNLYGLTYMIKVRKVKDMTFEGVYYILDNPEAGIKIFRFEQASINGCIRDFSLKLEYEQIKPAECFLSELASLCQKYEACFCRSADINIGDARLINVWADKEKSQCILFPSIYDNNTYTNIGVEL